MDLSSNKHMNVSMAAFDGLHDHTGGNAAGSAPKVQIFSGVSKGSTNSGNAVSSASISAGNVAGSLDLGKFGTFNQANPFRQDAPSMNTSSTTAEADDNLTLRKNAPRVNNINNGNSNGMEERCDDEDAHMNRRHGGGDVNGDDSQNEEERYNNIRHGSYGVRYKECLKNHAAKMGGYALDGCGEFMPAGEEGSLEGLRCAACGCHRNFHRREINGNGNTNATNMSLLALPSPINSSSTSANHNNVEYPEADHNHTNNGLLNVGGSPVAPTAGGLLRGHYAPGHLAPFLPHVHHHHHHPYVNPWMGSKLIGATGHPPALQVHHASGGNGGSGGAMQFNPYNFGMGSPAHVSSAAAGGSGGGIVGGGSSSGKRFRTKFTMEQREKMFEFSEKIGWRIQKQDEAAVQQFCAETGVKRHVLKVWMHNNKNTFGKKLLRFPEAFNAVPESSS